MLTAAKSGLANLIQYGKGMHVRNIFERKMLIRSRTLWKSLVEIFWKIIVNSKVIFISVFYPDDNIPRGTLKQ